VGASHELPLPQPATDPVQQPLNIGESGSASAGSGTRGAGFAQEFLDESDEFTEDKARRSPDAVSSEDKMWGVVRLAAVFSCVAAEIGWIKQVRKWNLEQFLDLARLSTHVGAMLRDGDPGIDAKTTPFNVDGRKLTQDARLKVNDAQLFPELANGGFARSFARLDRPTGKADLAPVIRKVTFPQS